MLEAKLKGFSKIDEVAREQNNGVYVVPSNGKFNIKIRDLVRYCKDNSKESSQLSQKEIEQFYR